MNTRRAIFAALALAVIPIASSAQDFAKGLSAYQRGDFEAALQEWRPLADQGHADAQYNLSVMYRHGKASFSHGIEVAILIGRILKRRVAEGRQLEIRPDRQKVSGFFSGLVHTAHLDQCRDRNAPRGEHLAGLCSATQYR